MKSHRYARYPGFPAVLTTNGFTGKKVPQKKENTRLLEEIIRLYSEVKRHLRLSPYDAECEQPAQKELQPQTDLPPDEKCTYAGRDTPKKRTTMSY